jgi:hypothetical protein
MKMKNIVKIFLGLVLFTVVSYGQFNALPYNANSGIGIRQEVLHPADTAGGVLLSYSSVINFLAPNKNVTNKYVYLHAAIDSVVGTNIDISLYGAWSATGTKILLTDAPGSIADLTNSAKSNFGRIDLNAYPMPYYFIGLTSDANNHAKTVTLTLIY